MDFDGVNVQVCDAKDPEVQQILQTKGNASYAVTPDTTVLQALQLMNDVQHIEAARAFAERLLRRPGDDDARLTYAFRCTTARRPERDELNVLRRQLAEHRRRYSASPADAARVVTNGESLPDSSLPLGELAAWTMVSNLVLNLDEAVARN